MFLLHAADSEHIMLKVQQTTTIN